MNVTIIVLAMIAAFLGLRLYSVLGKHGRDGDSMLPRAEERPLTAPKSPPRAANNDVPRGASAAASGVMVYDPAAEIGMRAILGADRSFDVGRFIGGARGAYRLILEAYWRGDRDALRSLCDADSYDHFATAIDEREGRGEVLDNRLVNVESATISAASLDRGIARITVRFAADIAAITRDKDGKIVAGSMTDAMTTEDVGSFARAPDSKDPSGLLDATDAH